MDERQAIDADVQQDWPLVETALATALAGLSEMRKDKRVVES